MKTLVAGRIYFSEYGDSWLSYAYVDATPECVEEAIYYCHQEREYFRMLENSPRYAPQYIGEYHLMADVADLVGFGEYYGGPGRVFHSSPMFSFVHTDGRQMCLIQQFGGYDI